jgi:hypothetical protein
MRTRALDKARYDTLWREGLRALELDLHPREHP